MERKWKIRDYREGDEKEIIELYNIVFGKTLSFERWNWIYNKGGDFSKFIALAESNDGKIVGHYALMPIKVKSGKNDCMIATLSLDTMVHPVYRRQGMFPILAKYLYDKISQQHVPFTYGFPNKNSYKGFIKHLNWKPISNTLPIVGKILNTKNVISKIIGGGFVCSSAQYVADLGLSIYYRYKKQKNFPGYIIEKQPNFGEWANVLWKKSSNDFKIAVVRDKEYLNWRYIDNPSENYSIYLVRNRKEEVGYMVTKFEERFGLKIGYLVDILILPEEQKALSELILYAVDHFSKNDIDIVNCLIVNKPYLKLFKSNGFITIPSEFYPQDINLCALSHKKDLDVSLYNEKNWFITWGDSDIV